MKKIIIVLPLLLLLAGCGLSNDEIIRETKKCKDAGMEVDVIYNGITYDIGKIQCVEKAILKDEEEICKNQGGVPIISSWTGIMKRCEFKPQ